MVEYTGADPQNPKGGAEETDDAVLHHSGSICDQTLRLNVKNFLIKIQEKGGMQPPRSHSPKSAPEYMYFHDTSSH